MRRLKVLLIVDAQKDFFPGGPLGVTDGDLIVDPIKALLESNQFDLIVASKDWHPKGHVSYAATHNKPVFTALELPNGQTQMMWPTHCEENTPGADYHPDLKYLIERKINYEVKKGTDLNVDSYSAFFDNNKEKETPLKGYLERQAAQRGLTLADVDLTVCGLALDYCVSATAIDAASLGIKTEVVLNATMAVDPKGVTQVLEKLTAANVSLVPGIERAQPRVVNI